MRPAQPPGSDSDRIEPNPIERLPLTLQRDLRSDHAGEWGAVMIYRGILATSRDPRVRDFARAHLETELRHLAFFESYLPRELHSRLLPGWCAAGWLLGAVAALIGRNWVFRTIVAVESFVDAHYAAQIRALREVAPTDPLLPRLMQFRAEEVGHRDDAAERHATGQTGRRGSAPGSLPGALWTRLIELGSGAAVALARRF